MAVWQHTLFLVPYNELDAYFGAGVSNIREEDFENINWWKNSPIKKELSEFFKCFLIENKRGDISSFVLGNISSNVIILNNYDDNFKELYVRIDLRKDCRGFIKKLALFASKYDLCFLNLNFQIIQPVDGLLINDVKNGRAFKFMQNPKKELDDQSEE